MIVGFSKHGQGKAQGAINYLLSENSSPALKYLLGDTNRKGAKRTPLPVVVRGNPTVTQKVINATPFVWRYTSGCLSFGPGETVSPQMEQKIMDEFESAAFAGLEKDQYSILWVRHAHTGREELHFVIPRIELRSGKSLNVAPPGKASRQLFDSFRSKINAEYGLSDPDDPARRRGLSLPAHVAKLKGLRGRNRAAYSADVRKAITRLVEDKGRAGQIRSRLDVIRHLESLGFHIHRQGERYLTVIHPVNKEHLRLRGAWYEQHWNETPTPENNHNRVAQFRLELDRLCRERAEYNKQRYTAPSTAYERNGLSFTCRRQTARIGAPSEGATIDARAQRIVQAAQRWHRACRNLELAGERFGRANRALATDFERKIAGCQRNRSTQRLLEKYGATRDRVSVSRELEEEMEMEMEIS